MGDVGEQGGAALPSAVGTGPAQAGAGTPQQPTDAAQARTEHSPLDTKRVEFSLDSKEGIFE